MFRRARHTQNNSAAHIFDVALTVVHSTHDAGTPGSSKDTPLWKVLHGVFDRGQSPGLSVRMPTGNASGKCRDDALPALD